MTDADFKVFAGELALLAEVFGEQLSATKIQGYFAALRDLPLEQTCSALKGALRTCRFFPRPVEIRDLGSGTCDDQAEVAWTIVRRAFQGGYGGYRPIAFTDPVIHAVVDAMGGWRRFHSLGFRDTEEVSIATTRKEFVHLYGVCLRRGVPAHTSAALCTDPTATGEPRRLGDGFTEPVVPMLPTAVTPAALPGPKEQIAPERVRELLNDLTAHHRLLEPKRPLMRQRRTRHARQVLTTPTAAELDAHEAKKVAAVRVLDGSARPRLTVSPKTKAIAAPAAIG